MQEEHVSNTTEVNTAPVTTAPKQVPFWKDLLVPASIVIAGLAVGAGMYFGGSGATGADPINLAGTAQQQPNLPADPAVLIPQLVDKAGVDRDEFVACFDSERTAGLVQEDADNAVATGGRGTPWSIVIGPNGNTFPLNGAVPVATIQQVIELARSGAEADPGDTDQINPVTDSDHVKGDRNAPIKIVEYSDFDCPFCSRFHASMKSVVESNDDVAWVYRHFPLDQLHPQARAVARAAECVAELGGNEAFWTFADGYFASK